jgi:hypothetical protein
VEILVGNADLNLGGRTFTPGLYKAATSLQVAIGQDLTLAGRGVYIFQMGTTLLVGDI